MRHYPFKPLLVVLIPATLFSSCFLKTTKNEGSSGTVAVNVCSYQERDTVSVAADPNGDFYKSGAGVYASVVSSNCDGLSAGQSASGSYDSVQRYGNFIYFKLGTAESIITMNGATGAARYEDLNTCVNGVQINGKLSSIQLYAGSQNMALVFDWTLTKNNCQSSTTTSIDPFLSANTSNYLWYLDSMPGDFIGQGKVSSGNANSTTLTATRNSQNGVSINYNSGGAFLTFDFASATGAALSPGIYASATRYPFNTNTNGLSVYGNGRGCNTVSGAFEVLNATYDGSGNVVSFAANFIQHCEDGSSFLKGSVRYNWAPPLL